MRAIRVCWTWNGQDFWRDFGSRSEAFKFHRMILTGLLESEDDVLACPSGDPGSPERLMNIKRMNAARARKYLKCSLADLLQVRRACLTDQARERILGLDRVHMQDAETAETIRAFVREIPEKRLVEHYVGSDVWAKTWHYGPLGPIERHLASLAA